MFSWDRIATYLPGLLEGASVTIVLALVSLALATVVGIVVAAGRSTRGGLAYSAAGAYVTAIRYTPELVQLYLVYFSLPAWGIVASPFIAATIVFGLHSGAFIAEVFRGGIMSIERSQWEASQILSLPRLTTWRVVILPQVVRRVLPAWGNYLLIVVKVTALAGVVTVPELFYRANVIATVNFRFFEIFTLVAMIYLAINLIGSALVRRLEWRLARSG